MRTSSPRDLRSSVSPFLKIVEITAPLVYNFVMGAILDWNMEDALAVRYEEGREEGREDGLEATARKALAKGIPTDVISEITGLDVETIKGLEKG